MSTTAKPHTPKTHHRSEKPSSSASAQRTPKSEGQRPHSEGQSQRPRRQYNNDRNGHRNGDKPQYRRPYERKPVEFDQSTLLFSNIDFSDLASDNTFNDHYVNLRVRAFGDLCNLFGKAEFQEYRKENNFVFVKFADEKDAKAAHDALADIYGSRKDYLVQLADKLKQKNSPPSISPKRFRVGYAHKTKAEKTVHAKSAQELARESTEKVVVANVNGKTEKKPKKEKKETPQAEQKPEEKATTQQQQEKPKKEKKEKKAEEKKPEEKPELKPEAVAAATEELRKAAEQAKLKDELKYVDQHITRLSAEINSEKERCTSRDHNISKLQEELERIEKEAERIKTKLNHEQEWKKSAESRLHQLESELLHFKHDKENLDHKLKAL